VFHAIKLVGEVEAKLHVHLNSTAGVGQRYALAHFPERKIRRSNKSKVAPVPNQLCTMPRRRMWEWMYKSTLS
jgi:hypothetical protein